jgi:hypothetical protein
MTTRQTRRGRVRRDDDAPVAKRPRGSRFIPLAAAAGDYATITSEGDTFRDTYRCVLVVVMLLLVLLMLVTVPTALCCRCFGLCFNVLWRWLRRGVRASPANVSMFVGVCYKLRKSCDVVLVQQWLHSKIAGSGGALGRRCPEW